MKQARISVCFVLIPALGITDAIDGAPALGSLESRITQEEIEPGVSLNEVRRAGLKMFATPFNKADGYGDGPFDPGETDTTNDDQGGRPSLAGNGTFLRVNGLDAQTCVECHSVVSAATVPFTFGIGGSGGLNNSPIFKATFIDVDGKDTWGGLTEGNAAMDGRLINPPALFGSGGVQLVGKEMTEELQQILEFAESNAGEHALTAKGVDFGYIVSHENGTIDYSNVEGVDDDLVIKPFGRKGEFSSVRGFDKGAMLFHFGMQPVEVVGEDEDADGDGVTNEVLVGELSALEIFVTTQERPTRVHRNKRQTKEGFKLFKEIGCDGCHVPELTTRETMIGYAFPEVKDDPDANVYYSVDLTNQPAGFKRSKDGGIVVPMFSDLKRHDMGEGLEESFFGATDEQNREFITAKLWGVADTAPYLHDGRALTLTEAILAHGGEAQSVRDEFASMSERDRRLILKFLETLRNPNEPNSDVLN
jgi:hypothetical protein